MSPLKQHQSVRIVCLLLVTLVFVLHCMIIPIGTSQTGEAVTALSYRAFSEIAKVYRTGGEAPDLVSMLNGAITLIQKAEAERLNGNETGAIALEENARSEINDVLVGSLLEQQKADSQSFNRTLSVIASIPLAVIMSTLIFIVGLGIWREYERLKLFEMRIIEKKTED